MIHAQIMAHFMSYHKHRLKIISLVDGAGVLWMAHARHPGQPDDRVQRGHTVVQVESCEQQGMVPVLVVADIRFVRVAPWVLVHLPLAEGVQVLLCLSGVVVQTLVRGLQDVQAD